MDTVTTTFLEMFHPPAGAPREAPEGVTVVRSYEPTVAFYRYLYDRVGEAWNWLDRRRMPDEVLQAVLRAPGLELYVLYLRGTPAGYSELECGRFPEVKLAYFGLMPEFIGRGLGGFFLDWTVRQAWRPGASRVWVHTCTLDHPNALPLYQKVGFRIYEVETIPNPYREAG